MRSPGRRFLNNFIERVSMLMCMYRYSNIYIYIYRERHLFQCFNLYNTLYSRSRQVSMSLMKHLTGSRAAQSSGMLYCSISCYIIVQYIIHWYLLVSLSLSLSLLLLLCIRGGLVDMGLCISMTGYLLE